MSKESSRSVKKNTWIATTVQTVALLLGLAWTGVQFGGWGIGVGQQWETVKALPPKVEAIQGQVNSLSAAVSRIGARQVTDKRQILDHLSEVAEAIHDQRAK